jgi:hypothetical protein
MMFWELPAVVVALLTWLTATPASLGDAGKREALRRQLTPKATRAYVVEDFAAILPGAALPATTPPGTPPVDPDEDPPMATAAKPPAAAPDAPAAPAASVAARDQEYWRSRMATARAALSHDQMLAEAMQSRINALTTDMINRDDPAQRAKLAADNQRAMEELARLQKQITLDEKAITAIQDEARRLSVPPGWIR